MSKLITLSGSAAGLCILMFVSPSRAETLSLQQAVTNALENHGSMRAGAEAKKVAAARISEMRGALAPRVTYSESWQRSDNQVFVFGSLLSQKQFTTSNFDIGSLNNPGFLNNFQSQVVMDQTVYDSGLRRSRIRAAELSRDLAGEDSRRTETEVIAGVARAYYTALVAEENERVAVGAVRSAEADLRRAQTRRSAGLTTDADVLSVRVHLAAMRERQIRSGSDLEIGLAALDDAMGISLDSRFELTTALEALEMQATGGGQVESEAAANRPEMREAQLALKISEANARSARASLFPEVYVRGIFEADRQRFVNRAGANWMASAGLRWNLFNGFSDRARTAEALHDVERSRAQARALESATRLEARRAWLDLESASRRIEVSRASVEMARESLRITRNRYETGLTEVTELLRSETALLEAQTRELEAVRDQRVAAVMLEAARGTLFRDSDVLRR